MCDHFGWGIQSITDCDNGEEGIIIGQEMRDVSSERLLSGYMNSCCILQACIYVTAAIDQKFRFDV